MAVWRVVALSLGALALIAAIGAAVWFSSGSSSAGVFNIVVDSVGDGADPTPGNGDCDDGSGNCTLRAAIETANGVPGTDTIVFGIAGDGPHTITPSSPLPEITDSLLIDGYSQPGASANTLGPKEGTDAVLLIEIDGSNAGPDADGLAFIGGGHTVTGLVINRFSGSGILLDEGMGNLIETRNRVQGNFLGTDAAGETALGNGTGVTVRNSWWNLIGGLSPAHNNLISGNGTGIELTGNTMLTNVQGNIIGAARDGDAALPNDSDGVLLSDGALCNTIGSEQVEGENIIAFNGGHAVSMIDGVGVNNYVDPNEMHSNGGLGIDLGDDGVTPNDVDDLDSGPNDLQNYPIITSAETSNPPGSIRIKATLDTRPGKFVNAFFFSNTECDPSGNGEGRTYLGKTVFGTGAAGDVSIDVTLSFEVPPGSFITTTVSTPESTSEFSPCFVAVASDTVRLQGDVDCDDDVDPVDGLALLRHAAGLEVNQQPGCPLIGSEFASIFGDVDCDDDVDSVDALKVLRHLVAFSVAQNEPCANIGAPL